MTPMTGYLRDSARPITSLAFAAPILMFYEVGVLRYGPEVMRNGADVWLRKLLACFGFGQYFLLPILACALLLALHHLRRERWSVSFDTLGLMLTETTALALGVVVIGFLYVEAADLIGLPVASASSTRLAMNDYASTISYVGAGVYEEVLFRLLIIPIVAGILRFAGESRNVSLAGAAMASSMLFAAAHYEIFTGVGEPFTTASFCFRGFAGLVFAAIFIFRGFGIAVGTHALYDLVAGHLNA